MSQPVTTPDQKTPNKHTTTEPVLSRNELFASLTGYQLPEDGIDAKHASISSDSEDFDGSYSTILGYYQSIDWPGLKTDVKDNTQETIDTYIRIDTSTLLATVLLASNTAYITADKTVRLTIIHDFRQKLLKFLNESPTVYSTLTTSPKLTLEQMRVQLNSEDDLGFEFVELISKFLNLDLYLVHPKTLRLCFPPIRPKSSSNPSNTSIVILYGEDYELVGYMRSNGQTSLLFNNESALVKLLTQ